MALIHSWAEKVHLYKQEAHCLLYSEGVEDCALDLQNSSLFGIVLLAVRRSISHKLFLAICSS